MRRLSAPRNDSGGRQFVLLICSCVIRIFIGRSLQPLVNQEHHNSSLFILHHSIFIKRERPGAPFFDSVAAISIASGAAAAGGAADAFVAGLFGAVDGVACAAENGGQDGNDEKIHITFFLSCFASGRP